MNLKTSKKEIKEIAKRIFIELNNEEKELLKGNLIRGTVLNRVLKLYMSNSERMAVCFELTKLAKRKGV